MEEEPENCGFIPRQTPEAALWSQRRELASPDRRFHNGEEWVAEVRLPERKQRRISKFQFQVCKIYFDCKHRLQVRLSRGQREATEV